MFALVLPVTHFVAMVVFAFFTSVTLALLGHRTAAGRIKYGLWCFALFVAIAVAIAWLMYPLSR